MVSKIWKWFWSIRILRLRPDDAIIYKSKEDLSLRQREEIWEVFKRNFPGHRILIMYGDAELEVVRHV